MVGIQGSVNQEYFYRRPFCWTLAKAAQKTAPLMLLLHGFRQNKEDALKYWAPFQGKAHLLAVDAPLVHEYARPRKIGKAWYVYDGDRGNFQQEMIWTAEALQGLVNDISRKIGNKRLFLGGFSQGAYMALYYSLVFASDVDFVHAVCGNLNVNFVNRKKLTTEVCLHYGRDDNTCPEGKMQKLEELLKAKKCPVSRESFKGGHVFSSEMATRALSLVQDKFLF
jgi:predicted esterase